MSISILELEEKIHSLEEVKVVIRLSKYSKLDCDYDYQRQLGDDKQLRDLISRIENTLNDKNIEFEIVNGNGIVGMHPSTSLNIIRNSYILHHK